MTGWKPPRITERTTRYLRHFDNMSDAEKLEYFDNIVASAFRKGYQTRKDDERKMHRAAAKSRTSAGLELKDKDPGG